MSLKVPDFDPKNLTIPDYLQDKPIRPPSPAHVLTRSTSKRSFFDFFHLTDDEQRKLHKFTQAEKIFHKKIKTIHDLPIINRCCSDQERTLIMKYADDIKQIPHYAPLSYRDIYVTLIFAYYGLELNEQTEDWLFTPFLQQNTRKPRLCEKLFLEITTGDLMHHDVNISSELRRNMMRLHGGKHKRTLKQRRAERRPRRPTTLKKST